MPPADRCRLKFPHKKWSGNVEEEQNYEAIERWAYRLPECYPPRFTPSTGLSNYSARFYGNQDVPLAGSTTPYPQKMTNWIELTYYSGYDASPAFLPRTSNLRINSPGLLLWTGSVLFSSYAFAPGYTKVQAHLQDNFWGLEQYELREGIPNGVPGLLGAPEVIVGLGGAHYLSQEGSYDTLELILHQWSPDSVRTVTIDIFLTLLTEAPVP